MPKYKIVKKTFTYLVYDGEALRRKAHKVAAEQDKDFDENHPDLKDDDRYLKHCEHLAEAEADAAEAGDEGGAMSAWLDEALIAADDPEADGDGYTLLHTLAENSNEQPSDYELGVLRLGIEIGHKLVRRNADGSTDIVAVRKVTPHDVYIEGDERRYWSVGEFPLTHSETATTLIGFADNVVPLGNTRRDIKPSLRGYLRHEAAYIILRERGEPMTTADLVAEMQSRGQPFFGQYPVESLQRAIRKHADRDGSMVYHDRKWSIAKELTIPPPSKWD
ncbi:winged helix-turn-helix domain-containing protein [Bradyrhizobium barranii subsp. barranii]|uniref:Winged helix-turn-helix domain-containing protein n=1 Tax=Bradyrhizobium barranii subsp. barranii TaxID=2823807 RepID=A0A939MBK3_9BRAD|nr:hypothetical protein [Bradyrhizobium barranii]UEM08439.1 winged helix-turn-helix domain-containing protein [Bradyrhizobium barranii subsp. barranii]